MQKVYGYEVEKKYIYKGAMILVVFHGQGFRCGYIGTPHAINPTNTERELTYSSITRGSHLGMMEMDLDDLYWVGFECRDKNDGADYESIARYFGEDKIEVATAYNNTNGILQGDNVCTCEYVESVCRKIIDSVHPTKVERKVKIIWDSMCGNMEYFYCPCGRELQADFKFCPECGAELKI